MTSHLERSIRLCGLVLALAVAAPLGADWCRRAGQLPPGYGAEGDRRRCNPMPAPIRATVEELSAGSDGSWVKGGVEGGAFVYELHVDKSGKSSVIRLAADGTVIAPEDREPEPRSAAGAGAAPWRRCQHR